MDGAQCWAGPLRRKDLAGPLGESWKDPANLRLLQTAAWHDWKQGCTGDLVAVIGLHNGCNAFIYTYLLFGIFCFQELNITRGNGTGFSFIIIPSSVRGIGQPRRPRALLGPSGRSLLGSRCRAAAHRALHLPRGARGGRPGRRLPEDQPAAHAAACVRGREGATGGRREAEGAGVDGFERRLKSMRIIE